MVEGEDVLLRAGQVSSQTQQCDQVVNKPSF